MINQLIIDYNKNKSKIKSRLSDFRNLNSDLYYNELIFCTLTPQSNAKKCWEAVKKLNQINNWSEKNIKDVLRKHTRFHNNKTKYILKNNENWQNLLSLLKSNDKEVIDLRNSIAEEFYGLGMKESSHFLRNIGKSDNKIAILDRHILRNLKKFNIIADDKIKNKNNYLEIERKYLDFANSLKIPADELDLLWWSQENGEIFK